MGGYRGVAQATNGFVDLCTTTVAMRQRAAPHTASHFLLVRHQQRVFGTPQQARVLVAAINALDVVVGNKHVVTINIFVIIRTRERKAA